jgi:hypothetical protein
MFGYKSKPRAFKGFMTLDFLTGCSRSVCFSFAVGSEVITGGLQVSGKKKKMAVQRENERMARHQKIDLQPKPLFKYPPTMGL